MGKGKHFFFMKIEICDLGKGIFRSIKNAGLSGFQKKNKIAFVPYVPCSKSYL